MKFYPKINFSNFGQVCKKFPKINPLKVSSISYIDFLKLNIFLWTEVCFIETSLKLKIEHIVNSSTINPRNVASSNFKFCKTPIIL